MNQHSFRVRRDGDVAAVTITDIEGDELADEIREIIEGELEVEA